MRFKSKDYFPNIGDRIIVYSLSEDKDHNGLRGVRDIITFSGVDGDVWELESEGIKYPVTDWYLLPTLENNQK